MSYKYLGDKFTAPELKGRICNSVINFRGKCIRGRNGSMLVDYDVGWKPIESKGTRHSLARTRGGHNGVRVGREACKI